MTALSESLLPACQALLEDDSDLEVVPFGEVVRRFLEMSGEEALALAQSGHQLAAIAHACSELPDDSPFHGTARFDGFHEALLGTWKELRSWGIDAGEMERISLLANSRLSAKLTSLAQVDREIGHVLAELGRSTHEEHLSACLEAIPELDGSSRRLLVFLGSEDAPMPLRWLEWASHHGVDVTAVTDRHATAGRVFAGSSRALELLKGETKQIGDANRLLKNLFADEESDGTTVEVSIESAADSLAEAEWALRACLALESFDRSAIYVRDLESYAPMIDTAAKRLKVPIRMARRVPLLTNSFARLTLEVLEACASFDVRKLAVLTRNSYMGLGASEQSDLRGSIGEAHSTRQAQWESLRAWADQNSESFPWLTSLLEWRADAMSSSAPISEWLGRLRMLVDALGWLDRSHAVEGYDARRDLYAQSAMQRVLAAHASVERVTGGRDLSLAQFAGRCRSLWERADVSVPPSEYGVHVCSSAPSIGEVDSLFVLGMLEGVFPRRRSEDPILTDAERAEISELRAEEPRLPNSFDKAQSERDEFYRVCAGARERLVFSYPQADDQRDNVPAFYLSVVETAAGKDHVQKRDYPRPMLAPSREACIAELDLDLREALDGPREMPADTDLVSEAARTLLQPPGEEAVTPSQLRDALQCAFQFIARRRLDLHVGRRANRWSRLRILPQSVGLVSRSSPEDAELALTQALEAELEHSYSELPEWEMQLMRSGGKRLIQEWIAREFRSRKAWPKDEGSVRVNVGFGTHGLRELMPGGVRLEGTVPAVSSIGPYSVTHLYGSTAKDSKDLSDPEKLYYGVHFLAMYGPGKEAALELEGMSGKRSLMVLGRNDGTPLVSNVQEGLQVVDLATSEDPAISKKVFFEDVKGLLAKAAERIRSGSIQPVRGDHCEWCDFGELCRRSKTFGEEESPFGPDKTSGGGEP